MKITEITLAKYCTLSLLVPMKSTRVSQLDDAWPITQSLLRTTTPHSRRVWDQSARVWAIPAQATTSWWQAVPSMLQRILHSCMHVQKLCHASVYFRIFSFHIPVAILVAIGTKAILFIAAGVTARTSAIVRLLRPWLYVQPRLWLLLNNPNRSSSYIDRKASRPQQQENNFTFYGDHCCNVCRLMILEVFSYDHFVIHILLLAFTCGIRSNSSKSSSVFHLWKQSILHSVFSLLNSLSLDFSFGCFFLSLCFEISPCKLFWWSSPKGAPYFSPSQLLCFSLPHSLLYLLQQSPSF